MSHLYVCACLVFGFLLSFQIYIWQILSLPALYSASNTMRECVYHCIVFNSNRSNAIVRLIDIIIAIYTLMLLSLFYASMVGLFYRFNGETKKYSTCRNLESSSSQVYFLISRLNFIPYANVVFLHFVEIFDLYGHGVYVFMLFGLALFEFIKQVKWNNSILNIILTLVYHKENPLDKTRTHRRTFCYLNLSSIIRIFYNVIKFNIPNWKVCLIEREFPVVVFFRSYTWHCFAEIECARVNAISMWLS